MKFLSRMVSIVAIRLLRGEWVEFREQLIRTYRLHSSKGLHPPILTQQLLISGEDRRFFRHGGIDPIAVGRAIWRGLVLGHREGASTIEMQIVRVVSGKFDRTLGRKIREMALATLLTREIPKDGLPALYLAIGYFGWRMNGFDAACRRLRLDARFLTPVEAARLVARLKYPEPHNLGPLRSTQIAARAEHLLRLHARHQYDTTYRGLVTDGYAAV